MKRIDALLNGIKDLETPKNRTTIKKLTEGINLMANEYRRRKSAESKALHEASGASLGGAAAIMALMGLQDMIIQIGHKLQNKIPLTPNEIGLLKPVMEIKQNMSPEDWNKMIADGKAAYDKMSDGKKSPFKEMRAIWEDKPQIGYNPESNALHEASGFAEIDECRKRSGLSTRAFLEGVGNDIIKSSYPDETKQKLMDKLSDYSKYLTEANNGRLGPFGMISLLAGFQNVVNQLGRKLKNKMPLTNPEMRLLNGVIALKNNIGETEWNQISGVKQPNPTAQPNPASQPAQQPAAQPQQ